MRPASTPWGAWLLLALALTAVFPYFEATRNANERPRLMQAMAWVDTGHGWIDGAGGRGLDAGPDTARSDDGHLYPNKPPGTTVVASVGYVCARAWARAVDRPLTLRELTWWARLFGGVIPTLVLAMVLWRRAAPRFGAAPSMAAVLCWALGTPALVYAHLLYGHALAAALLHSGIVTLGAALEHAARPRWRAPAIAAAGGMLAASAVTVEYMAAFAGLPIGLALLARVRRPGMPAIIGAALGGALLPIAALASYHQRAFGSPWSTGYQHATVADFSAKHAQGLLGLGLPSWDGVVTQLLAPDGGLLWWAPAVVLGVWGLLVLARDRQGDRFEAQVQLGVVAVFLYMLVSLSFDGGWRVGPRYFVLALPAVVIGWAELFAQARTSPAWTAFLVAVTGYGVMVNGLAANLWPHFDLANVDAPVAEVLLPLWEGTRRPYAAAGIVVEIDLVWIVVVASVLGFALVWMRVIEPRIRGFVAIGIGLVAALAMVAAHRSLPGNPRAARNLAYIEKVWEPIGTPPRSANLPELGGTDRDATP
jgi:hypothetical protein